MKTLKKVAITLLIAVSVSISAQTKSVDVAKSTINWTGKKVTGQHSGTLALKSGSLVFKKAKLIGGNFIVDMTTLANTDLKAGQGKEDLEGHLKSADFFGIDKFTTASLLFKKIAVKAPNVYTVTGDLTIKGIVKPITFDLATTTNSAATVLKVDRTKYDIKYGSGNFFQNLGDKTISDEFELAVALKF